jgi:hypothetical protein
MKSLTYGVLLAVAWTLGAAHAQGSIPADDETFEMPAADWLLVQTAKSVSYDGATLTLNGVSPQTIMFTDRPERMTGSVDTPSFVAQWGNGKGRDTFLKDPPNATLSSIVNGKEEISVVELTNPVLMGDSLSYSVRVLEGIPPKSGTTSTLFVDWWVGPHGGVCRHNAWGRVYCVPSYGRYPNPQYYNGR